MMRHLTLSAAALIALCAGLSPAAAQSQPEPAAQPGAPPAATQPGTPPGATLNEPAKPVAPPAAQGMTPDPSRQAAPPAEAQPPQQQAAPPIPQQTQPQITEQVAPQAPAQQQVAPSQSQPAAPPPVGEALGSREHERQAEEAMKTPSGQAGRQEPGASTDAAPNEPVSVGLHGVPGMPEDGQTTPAKFSERNAALDALPLSQMRLGLDDAERKRVVEALDKGEVDKSELTVSQQVPGSVALHDLPETVRNEFPVLTGLKYVRLADRILLVRAPSRVVVAEIGN